MEGPLAIPTPPSSTPPHPYPQMSCCTRQSDLRSWKLLHIDCLLFYFWHILPLILSCCEMLVPTDITHFIISNSVNNTSNKSCNSVSNINNKSCNIISYTSNKSRNSVSNTSNKSCNSVNNTNNIKVATVLVILAIKIIFSFLNFSLFGIQSLH